MKLLKCKALVIDHYDSFSYNLSRYFVEIGVEVDLIQYDSPRLQAIKVDTYNFTVLSPGPRHPRDIKQTIDYIRERYKSMPMLGVCLGHQSLAYAFGGEVIKAKQVLHGKLSTARHRNDALFNAIPKKFTVTRYHSLVVCKDTLPTDFIVVAEAENEIMSIKHRKYPLYGLQYHPEAFLTEYGHQVLKNFVSLAILERL